MKVSQRAMVATNLPEVPRPRAVEMPNVGDRCLRTAKRLLENGATMKLAALALLVLTISAHAEVQLHFAPGEDLERIDVATLASASHTIDLAAYSLVDPRVLRALRDAAGRHVKIRVVLDRTQLKDWSELVQDDDVQLRIMHTSPSTIMHLKA